MKTAKNKDHNHFESEARSYHLSISEYKKNLSPESEVLILAAFTKRYSREVAEDYLSRGRYVLGL